MATPFDVLYTPMSKAVYYSNEDGTVRVPAIAMPSRDLEELVFKVRESMFAYKWREGDVLLSSYAKNGCRFTWDIMMRLLKGSADPIKESKVALMFDSCPISNNIDSIFPGPRVMNTHLRIDVLPKEFQNRKTICVIRNPKDTLVSMYYHLCQVSVQMFPASLKTQDMAKYTFDEFFPVFLTLKTFPFGDYFSYVEYMWSLRDKPHVLVIFYEDLNRKRIETIQKMNEFMGTNRSPEVIEQIAVATDIKQLRKDKVGELNLTGTEAEKMVPVNAEHAPKLYRKGIVGDWKNHFSAAQNAEFDAVLEKWTGGKDIPFIYE